MSDIEDRTRKIVVEHLGVEEDKVTDRDIARQGHLVLSLRPSSISRHRRRACP